MLNFIPYLTALCLSAIAGYYSIIGLAKIFPGAFLPVVIMGAVLELSKLVTVSWLYYNWQKTNILMKSYFLIAIVLLMAITSMGIFGFLSRAHLETNMISGSNNVELQVLEEQEKNLRSRLQYLLRKAGDDPEKISRKTDQAITETQQQIEKIVEKKLPLLKVQNELKGEIGPIQYIAEIFYDKNDENFIDKAVRLVILIIIVVFDPLAVLLLIAANKSIRSSRPESDEDAEYLSVKKTDIFEMR